MSALYGRIVSAAILTGSSPEDAEDIAQEVLLVWHEYKLRHHCQTRQTVGQAVIDARRKLYGDARISTTKDRIYSRFGQQVPRYAVQEDIFEYLNLSTPAVDIADDSPDERLQSVESLFSLTSNYKLFLLLLFKCQDFTVKELSAMFAVSESRVSQIAIQTMREMKAFEQTRRCDRTWLSRGKEGFEELKLAREKRGAQAAEALLLKDGRVLVREFSEAYCVKVFESVKEVLKDFTICVR